MPATGEFRRLMRQKYEILEEEIAIQKEKIGSLRAEKILELENKKKQLKEAKKRQYYLKKRLAFLNYA